MRPTGTDSDRKRLLRAIFLTTGLYALVGGGLAISLPARQSFEKPAPRLNLTLTGRGRPEPVSGRDATRPETPRPFPSDKGPADREAIPEGSVGDYPDPGDTGDTVGVDAFSAWLDSEIRARLVYPERARRRNLEGTVIVSVNAAADGLSCEPVVLRSSGFDLLDRAAVELLLSLFPAPVAPGKKFADSVKIQYVLTHER